MTPEQDDQLRAQVNEIWEAVKGPKNKPREGLAWQVAQHHDDLYGTDDPREGMKHQVAELSRDAFVGKWAIRALGLGITAMFGFVGWVVSHWKDLKAIKP